MGVDLRVMANVHGVITVWHNDDLRIGHGFFKPGGAVNMYGFIALAKYGQDRDIALAHLLEINVLVAHTKVS